MWFRACYHVSHEDNASLIDAMDCKFIMTSSNGNIFRVTGLLWEESTGHRTKASGVELWCYLWSAPEQTLEQTKETPVIWDAIALIMKSL